MSADIKKVSVMKLVRFSMGGGDGVPGLLLDGDVIALSALVKDAPTDMRDVISSWDSLKSRLDISSAMSARVPLNDVTLLAPVPRPEKVLAIGLNYADHIEEAKAAGVEAPPYQVWFCKQANSLNSPFGDVEKPKVSDLLDYEVELVVVIGKSGRHISREDAPRHVFGYCVGNDFSVRDWQIRTSQWMLGKSFDTHAPIGPAIVTADEIADPHALDIRCYVNGELRQRSNTSHLIFDVWAQIEELSKAMTLKPGDLIFTGTPSGVGFAFEPKKMLKPGDVVRSQIEKLGEIKNSIVAE